MLCLALFMNTLIYLRSLKFALLGFNLKSNLFI